MLVQLLRAAGRCREAEEQFRRAELELEEHNVERTGTLRQAVQLPPPGHARTVTNNGSARPPSTERLSTGLALHDVRFCRTSDNVRIAYASVGNGLPLVWAAHWLSHLSFSWETPIWRHWTEEFGKDHCFVHYDEQKECKGEHAGEVGPQHEGCCTG
jgi:hypothetical protein